MAQASVTKIGSKQPILKKGYKSVRLGDYNGNQLLVFGDPESRFPFQFGKAKARQLLDAINEVGEAEFRALLERFTI